MNESLEKVGSNRSIQDTRFTSVSPPEQQERSGSHHAVLDCVWDARDLSAVPLRLRRFRVQCLFYFAFFTRLPPSASQRLSSVKARDGSCPKVAVINATDCLHKLSALRTPRVLRSRRGLSEPLRRTHREHRRIRRTVCCWFVTR